MRVAGRQHVLDDGTRRRARARGRVEQRPDLGQRPRGGESARASRLSAVPQATTWAARPIFARRLGPFAGGRSLVAARACCARLGGASHRCRRALAKALRVPHVDPARERRARGRPRGPARVVYSRNASLALIRRPTRSCPSRTRRSRCSGPVSASTPRSSAPAGSSVTSGTATSGCAASATRRWRARTSTRSRPTSPRGESGASTARCSRDESWFDARRTGPDGRRASSSASRRRSRRSSSIGLLPRQDVAQSCARGRLALPQALEAHGVHVAQGRAPRRAHDAGLPTRAGPLRAARRNRPVHGPRERQLHRRGAA